MPKFLKKVAVYVFVVMIGVSSINYTVDPANLYHSDIVDDMVDALSRGETVFAVGDVNEGYFKEQMIPSLNFNPRTVIIGSSHIMYIDWEKLYPDTLNAGVSGAYLGEYYAIIGLLKANDIKPERIIFGVDAWAFTRNAATLRHTTLNKYAFYVEDIVKGRAAVISDYEKNEIDTDKIKELLSFSYFQSSFTSLRNNGIGYYISHDTDAGKVRICNDDSPDKQNNKITPRMRYIMSLSNYGTVEENEAQAQSQVNPPNVYQLGIEYSHLDEENYDEFVELVDYLIGEGIEVSFYLPSYYPSIYDLFEDNSLFYGVLEVEEKTRQIAKERGIEVHGSYNPYEAGVNKEDFADCLHMTPDVMFENYMYQR